MKKIAFVFVMAFMAIGCNSDDDSGAQILGCTDPDSVNYDSDATKSDNSCQYMRDVTFQFTQDWNDTPVAKANFSNDIYTNAAGDFQTISKLRYLISNIKLYKENGDVVQIEGYNLIDVDKPSTATFNPGTEIITGNYTGISFVYGFNEADNKNGIYPDLNDASWNWPSMLGGGYHFMQMEGNFDDATGASMPYAFHNGTARVSTGVYEQNFIEFNFDQDFTIENNVSIEINMNIAEWFVNPVTWDLNEYNSGLMMNYTAQKLMKQNGATVFSIGAINQ